MTPERLAELRQIMYASTNRVREGVAMDELLAWAERVLPAIDAAKAFVAASEADNFACEGVDGDLTLTCCGAYVEDVHFSECKLKALSDALDEMEGEQR